MRTLWGPIVRSKAPIVSTNRFMKTLRARGVCSRIPHYVSACAFLRSCLSRILYHFPAELSIVQAHPFLFLLRFMLDLHPHRKNGACLSYVRLARIIRYMATILSKLLALYHRPKICYCLCQTILQWHFRFPAKKFFGKRDVWFAAFGVIRG